MKNNFFFGLAFFFLSGLFPICAFSSDNAYFHEVKTAFGQGKPLVFHQTPFFKVALFSCASRGFPSEELIPFSFQVILKDGFFLSRDTTASYPILWPIQYDPRGFSDRISLPFYAPLSATEFTLNAAVCNDAGCFRDSITLPFDLPRGRFLESGYCPYIERMALRHPSAHALGIRVHEVSLQGRMLKIHFDSARPLPYLRIVQEGEAIFEPIVHKIRNEKYGYVLSALLPDAPDFPYTFILADRQRGMRLTATADAPFPSFDFGEYKARHPFLWVVFGLVLILIGVTLIRCQMEKRGIVFKPYTQKDFKALLRRIAQACRRAR